MATPRTRLAAILALTCLPAGVSRAGGAQFFKQDTAKEFEEGEATATMVLPTGTVVAGMKTTRVPVDAAFAWSAATSPDGQTAYFGTGDQGRVYAVGAKSGNAPARLLVQLDAGWVTSLVAKPDGTLLAGTTPGGRIYLIDPRKGIARELAKVKAEHVWALAYDARGDVIYAATGGPGAISTIDAKGTSRVMWDSGDKHIVSLLYIGDGALLAGTAEDAILYRVRSDGHAEALHDFDANEVRAIARAGAATILAVNDFDESAEVVKAPLGPAAISGKGTPVTVSGAAAPVSAGALPRPGQVKAKSAVYRLGDDGNIEQVFTLADGYLTSLLADVSGDVYAGAGVQGKLYKLHPDRTASLVADLPERQLLCLVRDGDGFLAGAGDVGGVYRVRPAAAGEASYLSRVFDGEFPSAWGRLRWVGSPTLSFETRSGNTAKPDKNWGAWRKIEQEGRVASSRARYLQYRVGLAGKDAALNEVVISYSPQNQRPNVTDIFLADTGAATVPVAPAPARNHSSILKLRWKTENADKDELIFRLAYRQPSESAWRWLGGPDPLAKAEYDWNTESVPDGNYVVRVWVSDEKVTPADRALDSSLVSPPFLVDNTRPAVEGLVARGQMVSGRAKDAASFINQIEYAVDGGDWRPASPGDGVLDQREEAFSLKLPALAHGTHVVTVRAWDAADNLGAARVVVEVK